MVTEAARPSSGTGAWSGIGIRALLYFGIARLSLALIEPHTGITAVWPAGGLLLAFIMTVPRAQWPALCAEVGKLRISTLDGEILPLATNHATTELSAQKRWRKHATPTGFEPVLPA